MDTKKLKQKILDLAIHGKLVPQDPNDEPASVLLARIREEKLRLIKEGKIKKAKKSDTSDTSRYENVPFDVPEGWVWCSLSNIVQINGRIGFRGYTKEDLVDKDGAITLSPSNIINGQMNYDKCTYISWAKYEESPEIMVNNEDILLVKTGSSYGKCAFVMNLPKESTINPQFVVIKTIADINAQYVTYYLQSTYAKKLYENFVLGTAIPTFTQVALGNMKVPLPSVREQNRIVKQVEKWMSIVDILDDNVKNIQGAISSAKSKILDLAIRGKLVPQDPHDEPASELLKRINPKAQIATDNAHYGKVPSSWEMVSMEQVCSLTDGKKESGTERINLDVKFMRGEREAKTLTEGKFTSEGTLLILVDGENSGEVFIAPCDGYQGSTFKQLHINENLSTEYLLNVISLHRKELRENKVGSAIPHLNKKLFKAIDVPLPPYNEQLRIVKAINIAFSRLDSIAENL